MGLALGERKSLPPIKKKRNKKMEEQNGLVEGIRLSGEFLKVVEKKTFEIISIPKYIEMPNFVIGE